MQKTHAGFSTSKHDKEETPKSVGCGDVDTKWDRDKNLIIIDTPLIDGVEAIERAYDLLVMLSNLIFPSPILLTVV